MAWLYILGAEVDDPVMQAEDNGFDYIDPNPMGSKLTEFFQTVEKKNWLNIDGVTFSEEDCASFLNNLKLFIEEAGITFCYQPLFRLF